MSTDTIDATSEMQTVAPAGPPNAAIEAYRKAVFDVAQGKRPDRGGGIEEVIRDSWRTRQEFREDLATFAARVSAVRNLATKVPKFKQQLAEAQQAEHDSRPDVLTEKPLADFATLGELAAGLAVLRSQQEGRGTMTVCGEKLEVNRLRNRLRGLESEALRTLATTADPELHNRVEQLGRERTGVEIRMKDSERANVLRAAGAIEQLEQTLAELDAAIDANAPETEPGMRRTRRKELRGRLARFRTLDRRRASVEQANAADEAELERIEKQAAAVREKLQAPENMRWATIPEASNRG